MVHVLSPTASRILAGQLRSIDPGMRGFYEKVDASIKSGTLTDGDFARINQCLELSDHTELTNIYRQMEFSETLGLTIRGFVLSFLASIAWLSGTACFGIIFPFLTLASYVSALLRFNTKRVQGTRNGRKQASGEGVGVPGVVWALGVGYAILAAVHFFETPLRWLLWIPMMFFMRVFAAPILAYLMPAYQYLLAVGASGVAWARNLSKAWTPVDAEPTPPPPPPDANQTSSEQEDVCPGQISTLSLCQISQFLGGLGGAESLDQTLRYLLAAALVVNASFVMTDMQTGNLLALPAHAPLPSFVAQRERIQFYRRPDMSFDQEEVKTKFQRAAEEKQAEEEKKPVDSGKGAYDWYINLGFTVGVSVATNIGIRVGKHAFDLAMTWAVRHTQLGVYAPVVRILVAAVSGLAVQQFGETSVGWHTLGALATSGAAWQSFSYIGEWIVKQWGVGEAVDAALDDGKLSADAGANPANPAGAAAENRAATVGLANTGSRA